MSDENKCLNKPFYISEMEIDFSSIISRFEKQLIDLALIEAIPTTLNRGSHIILTFSS